jgi:hypothetical protein
VRDPASVNLLRTEFEAYRRLKALPTVTLDKLALAGSIVAAAQIEDNDT